MERSKKLIFVFATFLLLVFLLFGFKLLVKDKSSNEIIIYEELPEEVFLSIQSDYASVSQYSLQEALEIVSSDLNARGISRLDEFEYMGFDPKKEENSLRVLETILEHEKDFPEVRGTDTLFYMCVAQVRLDFNYCLKIEDLYFRSECIEGVQFIRALMTKNSSPCLELGTHKIYPWCKATLERDSSYCEENSFENIIFKKNCYAFSNRDFSYCQGHEEDCLYDYYFINAIYERDVSQCDNIFFEGEGSGTFGEMEYCRAIFRMDIDYCKREYLPSKLVDIEM